MVRTRMVLVAFFLALAWSFLPREAAGAPEPFRRGDSNTDGAVNIGDPIHLLIFLFLGGPGTLPCRDASDADINGTPELSDVIYLLAYLFLDGQPPAFPGPRTCGLPSGNPNCERYPASCGLPPEITMAPAAVPSAAVSGERSNLSVTASDPDGAPLTYSWTQIDPPGPLGIFISGQGSASAAWRSPAVGEMTVFTLQVTVTDQTGKTASDTVSVTANVPPFASGIQPIFTSNCSCHMGTFPSANLNLESGKSFASLVNVTAIACGPRKRVLPGDPDSSVLWSKISGDTCGTRMPIGNPSFFDTNPNLLLRSRSWIQAGAAND